MNADLQDFKYKELTDKIIKELKIFVNRNEAKSI